jgi:6-phosphogluconolactonase/glucosamine-6-phosphate isomerase/deaminase
VIRFEVLEDAILLAERAAAAIQEIAAEAVSEHGGFAWAISGGSTPLRTLASLSLPWERTATFQVDERVAPAGDPDRNLRGATAALPAEGAATLRPMPVEAEDLDAAAEAYASLLPGRLEVVQLGLGEDGHTASLIPGDPVLEVRNRDVAVTGEYRGRRRMTLTYPPLGRARSIVWIVSGAAKEDALARLLARDRSIPAARVAADDQLVLADRDAAARV